MKKYIVKGTDLPSLLSKVAKHFNVDINKIKYEVLRKTPELEVKVWTEHETEAPEDNNFSIELRDDGIFLTVKEIDDVKSSTLKKILKYMEENKIKDTSIEAIEEALFKLNEAVKIAEFDKEYYIDSVPIIEVFNNMEATLKITKPNKGRETTLESILKLAEEKGIVFGLRKKAIQTMLSEKIYDRKVILAKGKDVKHGTDAIIKYTFQKTSNIENTSSKSTKDVKSIDFKELNLFQNVAVDEILAQKIPLTYGEDGIDIFGKTISAKVPKDIQIIPGRNTYLTDDEMYLKSQIDGQLIQKGKSLSVEPLLTIPGNVDYATGNIDFLGSVIVKGNVISGFSIKSGEDIYIEGLVEDCELTAEGSIMVNNGILGNEEFLHTIYAKEGIKAQFIQHMKIKTNGSVEVNKHILHSTVEAGDKVIVTSGTGKIIGGEIKAQKGIECNIAGGPFETPTKLILDVYSETVKEESEINKEMLVLEENKFKIEKLLKDVE
ncbi:MAG: DUF342 domain-containing protein, partial [Fusobacteriaceae bacterium]|nr:DUF342 domain-containing protein [Fusobacteriaceae bacterium]MBP6466710.1 DUF342 domain-containing protein [Fusobacteriaceae bacterium]